MAADGLRAPASALGMLSQEWTENSRREILVLMQMDLCSKRCLGKLYLTIRSAHTKMYKVLSFTERASELRRERKEWREQQQHFLYVKRYLQTERHTEEHTKSTACAHM